MNHIVFCSLLSREIRSRLAHSFGRKSCGTGALAGGFLKKHRHNYLCQPALYCKRAKQDGFGSLCGHGPLADILPLSLLSRRLCLISPSPHNCSFSHIYFSYCHPERSAATLRFNRCLSARSRRAPKICPLPCRFRAFYPDAIGKPPITSPSEVSPMRHRPAFIFGAALALHEDTAGAPCRV
jgi:hypothetical protein